MSADGVRVPRRRGRGSGPHYGSSRSPRDGPGGRERSADDSSGEPLERRGKGSRRTKDPWKIDGMRGNLWTP